MFLFMGLFILIKRHHTISVHNWVLPLGVLENYLDNTLYIIYRSTCKTMYRFIPKLQIGRETVLQSVKLTLYDLVRLCSFARCSKLFAT